MPLYFGLIVVGLRFSAAYLFGKGKIQILAVYVEGQVKDNKKASKYLYIYITVFNPNLTG